MRLPSRTSVLNFLKDTKSVGIGAALFTGYNMYSGEGAVSSVAKGVGRSLVYKFAPQVFGVQIATSIVPSIAQGVTAWSEHKRAEYAQTYMPNMAGKPFQDTKAAYTMRQRGVNAIQQSRVNARGVLGREASLTHRGMR